MTVVRNAPQQVRAGEQFSYEILVRNNAAFPVREVIVNETAPAGFQVTRAEPQPERIGQGERTGKPAQTGESERTGQSQDGQQSQPTQHSRNERVGQQSNREAHYQRGRMKEPQSDASARQARLRWTFPILNPGEARVIRVQGTVRQEGAAASCVGVDYTPAVCSQVEVVKPELSLASRVLDADGNPASRFYSCEPIVYSLNVTNQGTAQTENATVQLQLPQGLQAEQGSDQLTLGSIAPGRSVERRVQLQPQQAGSYTVRASAQTPQLTVSSEEASIEVLEPELALAVDAPRQEYVDRTLDVAIRVKNAGDVTARDVALTIDQPSELRNVSVSG
ncbi:MAG: hypothetical protein KDD69_14965, partial [Bdellovibrionales bacterium]|nr:hypothetical protein [Bdellovibrionales bacterium]